MKPITLVGVLALVLGGGTLLQSWLDRPRMATRVR